MIRIRIRIPPFRLIQIEFFTLNAETFLQIERQLFLWFYYGFNLVSLTNTTLHADSLAVQPMFSRWRLAS
jgi:hypothetical protein